MGNSSNNDISRPVEWVVQCKKIHILSVLDQHSSESAFRAFSCRRFLFVYVRFLVVVWVKAGWGFYRINVNSEYSDKTAEMRDAALTTIKQMFIQDRLCVPYYQRICSSCDAFSVSQNYLKWHCIVFLTSTKGIQYGREITSWA